MKELKRGDTLQVTIEAATVDGTGIARVDGQVVFVPGALPANCAESALRTSDARRSLPSFCAWSSRRRTA